MHALIDKLVAARNERRNRLAEQIHAVREERRRLARREPLRLRFA
jgi:hypothetical protein